MSLLKRAKMALVEGDKLPKQKPIKKTIQDTNRHQSKIQQTQQKSSHHQRGKDSKQLIKPLSEMFRGLQGGKFRMLNEMLYTSASAQSLAHFQAHKEDFQAYHRGYREQASKWDSKPVELIAEYLIQHQEYYKTRTILDVGCGQGILYELLKPHQFTGVHSYDLVSTKPFIKVCDARKLPHASTSVDLVVYCLSLMGSNYLQYVAEAYRVLKHNGDLLVGEVQSRSKDWSLFYDLLGRMGFRLRNNGHDLTQDEEDFKYHEPKLDQSPRYFRLMCFSKAGKPAVKLPFHEQIMAQSLEVLAPCIYKKR